MILLKRQSSARLLPEGRVKLHSLKLPRLGEAAHERVS